MKDRARKKIIMVDDINLSLMSGKSVLKNDYEVYPAPSPAKLFEILENVMPDLILLDINMPGEDGFETLKKLKSDDRYARIPVIFLSALNDEESVVKGMALGAADHVRKPYYASKLISSIENQLNPGKRQIPVPIPADEYSRKPCILAVDDAPAMLRSVNYALRDDYSVSTLLKPEGLKDLLEKIKPALFLLDYNMPVLNGFELVPIIRELPEHKETPIIFLTAEGTVDNLSVAIHLGACDFIVKPFKPDVLREKIAKHIAP